MDSTDAGNEPSPTERFNYFNYFTEVEEEFVRRRGKPLLVSPMDWALIESWKDAGIPLHVVLRAINQAFDAYEARRYKYRKVNSIFYCQQEVESTFAEYRLAQVGTTSDGGERQAERSSKASREHRKKEAVSEFPKEVLLDFLARSDSELQKAAALASDSNLAQVELAISRARARLAEIATGVESSLRVKAEAIERDLDAIDRMILDSLVAAGGQNSIEALRAEAEIQLRPYRKKMDKAIYAQTIENFIWRRLREMNQIPRLSLFYI